METKRIDNYFKKTQQLPLAMSLAEVKSLIRLKGVTSPPKKSWWNLNNIIIMSTSIIIVSAVALFFNTTSSKSSYEPISSNLETFMSNQYDLEEDFTFLVGNSRKEEKSQIHISEGNEPPKDLLEAEKNQSNKSENEEIILLSMSNNLRVSPKPEESILDELEPLNSNEPNESILNETEPLESNLGGEFEGEEKKVTKAVSANNVSTLYLDHRNGDIDIKAWDQNEIEVTAIFKLKTDNAEDTRKGLEDFDIDLNVVGSKLSVKSNWDKLNNCNCSSNQTSEPKGLRKLFYFPTKNEAKTDQGESFEYENFKIIYEIKIPRKLNIDVSNKYANISVPEVNGDLSVTLFRGILNAENVSNNADLNVKYGSVQIGDFIEGKVSLFRSDATIGTTNHLTLKANYSTINYNGGKELNVTAFRTDLKSTSSIDNLEGSFKYGDLTLKEHIKYAKLTLFRALVDATTFDNLRVDASYSEVKAISVNQFDIENAFRCDFKFDEAAMVKGNLKYTPIKIGVLTNFADINAFRGAIEIKQVNADFKQLNFETKYTDIDLSFNPEAKYELDAQTIYSDFKASERMKMVNEQDEVNHNSNHFIGTFNETSSKTASKVFVNSFQGVIRLN